MDAATNGGYVKLWRSWIDHPIWADMPPACGRIALTCLCLANWKPAKWYDGRAEVTIPRGSFVTSLEKLSAAAGTSKKQTRYGLHKLEFVAQFLTTKRTHRWTLISITNYELYQSKEAEEGTVNNAEKGTLGAQQGHSKGTVVALIEEGKKGRREEQERDSPSLPSLSEVDDPPFDPGSFPEPTAAPPNGPRWGAAEKRGYFNESFWPIAWLKRGKGAAEKAFCSRASSKAVADALLAKAIEQGPLIVADAERNRHSILHPSTWLNARRDEDDWSEPQERSDGW